MRFLFFNEWVMYHHNGDVEVLSLSFNRYYTILTVMNFTFELNYSKNE